LIAAFGAHLPGKAVAQCTLPHTLTNGTPADATQVMANYNALVTCLGNAGVVNGGTIGQIALYNAAGSTISGLSLSDILDQTFSATRGSLLYRGASAWTALPPGTSGFLLQTGGTGADPVWVASGGGGGIATIVAAGTSATAATVALAPGPVISRPAAGVFSWVNQGNATVTDHTNGPLVLRSTQITSGTNLNALLKSVAGASWTVTVNFAVGNHVAGSADTSGLAIYNNVTGRLYVSGLDDSGSVRVWSYNSATSFNNTNASKTILLTPYSVWLRAQYVSGTTTLTFSYSIDGFTWETILTTNAPFVGVPTHYGISIGSFANSAGYALSLNSMLESSP
jgi:hypothetical protein